MNRMLVTALGIGMVFCAPPAGSSEKGDSAGRAIDEIVVVANKAERSIRDVAANVTVLTREDLDLEMATSIADVLRYSPGIDYEAAGTRFGTEGINIRGIGGNRVAILLDGVPLSDQFDVGSFSNATRDFLNAGFMQRAEILHGPASALYGSAAIGGVVALTSPSPAQVAGRGTAGGNLVTAWREADSSLHGTALHAISGPAGGLVMGISTRDGSEYESAAVTSNLDIRDYRRQSAMLKLELNDVVGGDWRFGYYGQDSDVTSSLSSMLGSGRFRSTTALEGDDRNRMDVVSGELHFGENGGLVDSGLVRVYFGATDVVQQTLDERGLASRPVSIDRLFSFEQRTRGVEANLRKAVSLGRTNHLVGFGVEYRERRTEEFRNGLETGIDDGLQTNVLLGEVFPLRDFPISDSADMGLYLEDAIAVGDWTVIAGLRADRYALDPVNDAMYAEDYPFAEPVPIDDGELSPKFGLIYRPSERVDLYLQYSHGFRAPPYEDANIGLELPLFNIRAVPNPDLRPESSDGIDVGIRWRGERLTTHLSLFRTGYDDFIESKVRLGPDPESGRILFQSQNINEARIEGLEAGWTFDVEGSYGRLGFDGAVYWSRGENRDNGLPLNSVGPAQAVLGVDWSSDSETWQLRLKATLTDGWTDLDESGGEPFSPPGHAVFDFFATRNLGDRVRLRAGVTNLADRVYWSWSDVRGLGPDDPVIPYLARPGRSAVLGMDVNW